MIQSNATFGLSDRLEVNLNHVRMPPGNGADKTKGHSLDMKSAIKKSTFTFKAALNYLAYALIIAMAWGNDD